LIGLGALVRATRLAAVVLGVALSLDFWLVGQQLGALWSGHATDLNTGPVLALMGIAIAGLQRAPVPRTSRAVPAAAAA
jgi:hypothetical protein